MTLLVSEGTTWQGTVASGQEPENGMICPGNPTIVAEMTNTLEPAFSGVTIPLRNVVEHDELGIAVIAGIDSEEDLDRPVRWAHVSELALANPGPYLLGEELLLTAGVDLTLDAGRIDHDIAGLSTAGVTALGFGIAPVFDAVPQPLIDACNRHHLPLLAIPERTPFLTVCRTVGAELTKKAQAELRRLSEAQQAMTTAAAGHQPRPAVLRTLADRIGGWALLAHAGGQLLEGQHAPASTPPEISELHDRVHGGSGLRSAAAELPDGTYVLAQPLRQDDPYSPVLTVGKPARFDVTDRAVIAVGLALLSLITQPSSGAELAALTGLLLGRDVDHTTLSSVFNHEHAPHDYRVIAGTPRTSQATDPTPELRARLATPLIGATAGGFTAIVDHEVLAATQRQLYEQGWLTAISSAYLPKNLPEADREARLLLERATSLGKPLRAEETDTGFCSTINTEAAQQFARRLLAPLTQHPQLSETLRCWLAHHGNWDRTAAALDVHRNSVRHRISRAQSLLKVDVSDPQVRMELWFALRWLSADH